MRRVYNEILDYNMDIPDEPRVVSLAPSNTDILYQIGAWDYVVGVSLYCNIPTLAKEKPRVGSYVNVIYKRLDKLSPDIIFTTTGVQRPLNRELMEKGYNVYPLGLPLSPYGIIENIIIMGNVLGLVEEAYRRADYYLSRLYKTKRGLSIDTYYEVDLGGPITIGSVSYINSGLYHIGLRNIFMDISKSYIPPDFDRVRELNPRLIIYENSYGRKLDPDELVKVLEDRGWGDVDAVREGNLVTVGPDYLAHYGPTFIDNLSDLLDRVEDLDII
jgi:ABC-type Fe3+-hydroxamate transport system substrate-binding protein